MKKKVKILSTDIDFANYGRLRECGKSPKESLAVISLGKKLKFKKK